MAFQSVEDLLSNDAGREWLRRRGVHIEAPIDPQADITAEASIASPEAGGKTKPEGQDVPDLPQKALDEMPQAAQAVPDAQPVTPTRKPLLHVDAVPPAPAYQPSKMQQAAQYLSGAPTTPPPAPDPGSVDEAGAADQLSRARAADSETMRQHNIGEGLRQFLSGFGNQQRYQPKLESPPSETEFAMNDLGARRKQAADYLLRKRQGEQDAIGNRLKESEIGKNQAETLKALREKPATGNEDVPGLMDVLSSPAFAEKRSQFGYGTPNEIASASTSITGGKLGDAETSLRPLPPDKEALKELRQSFEGERSGEMARDATIEAARTAAGISHSLDLEKFNREQTEKLSKDLAAQHIPETLATIGSLRTALAEHGGDLPGVGPIAGRSLPLGIDTWLRSDEGTKYRNQVQQMQEAHRVAVTGAGAGPTELAMLNQTIISPTDNMATFKAKMDAFEELVQSRRRGIEAGHTGETLDRYLGQLQNVKNREAPKQQVGGKGRGKVLMRNPKTGETVEVDE